MAGKTRTKHNTIMTNEQILEMIQNGQTAEAAKQLGETDLLKQFEEAQANQGQGFDTAFQRKQAAINYALIKKANKKKGFFR